MGGSSVIKNNTVMNSILPMAVIVWLVVAAICAASVKQGLADDRQPITITSNRMEGDFKSGVIVFLEQVKVVRGDMVLHADRVEIYPKDKGQEIDKMVATGHVRVASGTRSSFSDHVEYIEESEILILTGNAKVSDGHNTITGPIIRVYLREDRTEVEGNTVERPRFLFYPDDLKEKEAGSGN
jgi:lipopolysaccharide export system protein LptA